MANWSQLLEDLLVHIVERLPTIEDFVRFGEVCQTWRSTFKKHYSLLIPQFPWLMLAEKENSDSTSFYGLSNKKVFQLNLPEARRRLCCGSSHGWLITIGTDDLEIHLLNPLTRAQIRLPPQTTFRDQVSLSQRFIHKAILSSSPSPEQHFMVMAIHSKFGKLAFARPGDKAWTTLESPSEAAFRDIVYFSGQFYALCGRKLMICEINGSHLKVTDFVALPDRANPWVRKYLVESSGKLYLVLRFFQLYENVLADSFHLIRYTFNVYKLDTGSRKWVEVKNLGDHVMFLGTNSSFCASVSNCPGCRSNCIYFTYEKFEPYDKVTLEMAVFSLEDGTMQHFYVGQGLEDNLFGLSPTFCAAPDYLF